MTRTILLYALVWAYAFTLAWTLCECVRGSCPVPTNTIGSHPPPD